MFDDVGGRVPHRGGAGFVVSGAHGGQGGGDTAGGGDEEVSAARGGVDGGDGEQRCFGVGGSERFVDERVEGLVDDEGDEVGGAVVGPGGFAVVAGRDLEDRGRWT